MTTIEVNSIAGACSIDAIRTSAIEAGDPLGTMLKDGARGFFYKGTNARWRDVLNATEIELYEDTKQRVLPADSAAWLETGGPLP